MNKTVTIKSEIVWFPFKQFEFLNVICPQLQRQRGILKLASYGFEEKI